MTWQLKLAGWGASVAIVFGLLFTAYAYGRHVENIEQTAARDKAIQEQQDKNTKELLNYAEQIKKGQIENDKNRAVIAKLHADIDRVRVHFPASALCAAASPSASADEAGGVLSNRVDALFADFQRRTGELIQQCDQLNADAIRLNADTQ